MKPISSNSFDLGAMHERACRAIFVLQRTQKEISNLMGVDTSIPWHERKPLPPTMNNIKRAAQVIGVSVEWLMYGIPKNQTDMFVLSHQSGNSKSVFVTENKNCTIVAINNAGA